MKNIKNVMKTNKFLDSVAKAVSQSFGIDDEQIAAIAALARKKGIR
jgi:hypothetical protein